MIGPRTAYLVHLGYLEQRWPFAGLPKCFALNAHNAGEELFIGSIRDCTRLRRFEPAALVLAPVSRPAWRINK